MLHHSVIEQRGAVTFPEFRGERLYMLEFTQHEGLPTQAARWQGVVDQMLEGIQTDGPMYLMVDERSVLSGHPHRRPGLHVDGYWCAGRHVQHRSVSLHSPFQPSHRPSPDRAPGHGATPNRHAPMSDSWESATWSAPEGILLASNVSAARGYAGGYLGPIRDRGDCSEVNVSNMTPVTFCANTTFATNVNGLHESVPVEHDCFRQLVRLNVPGWTPTQH